MTLNKFSKAKLSKVCGCGCGKALEPRVDGERHKINGNEVNDECYFAGLSEVVEKNPPLSMVKHH